MITAVEVVAAYKAILDRPPENDDVVKMYMSQPDLASLCELLVGCPEFKSRLAAKFGAGATFGLSELDQVAQDFKSAQSGRWAGRSLRLPDWVDVTLAADGEPFRDQVRRLWSDITGRASYDAASDEDTPEIGDQDALYRPAFYASGSTAFAGAQIMAMGHIILRSGIGVGDRVLEYGAGFGQTAVALARVGAKVDTVDINPAFCRAVDANAQFYNVDLKAHTGAFGYNPQGRDGVYDLIFFYESFHHCFDFHALIPRLKALLKPTGRVILAGEPIFDGACQDMPYPWGIRLDWENVAVMRLRGWMELGFQKDYLLDRFGQAGFACRMFPDENSHWAQVYEFRQV